MFAIGNVYGHGFDCGQVSKLEALGFRIRPQISSYMGAQTCRFIDFETGPSLELIEVEDDQEYLEFVPEGMKPYCPGISLVLPAGSATSIGDFEHEFRQWHPYALRVNYDGSLVPAGPGWNYLNFKLPVVPDTFIWLTAYDEPRPPRELETTHPNGVTGLLGLVFDLEIENLKGFSRLVKGTFVDGVLAVGDLAVWSKSAVEDSPTSRAKALPLMTIVLKAKSLDTFAAGVDYAREVSFRSQPAILIETNRLSWDLLLTA